VHLTVTKKPFFGLLAVFILGLPAFGQPVLWQNPAEIGSRDLFYGLGGQGHQPQGPVTFLEEDLAGTNPKFDVRDKNGVKWKVKLGLEARPETVASRITWAVGYYVDDEYFMQDLQVEGLPAHLHRGQSLIAAGGFVHNVRLKRHAKDEKKIGDWKWRKDPFSGTRELNGLRVLMAVLDNWDLKDENNHIYKDDSRDIYMVSDLGASFGSAGRSFPPAGAKGNVASYSHAKFIRKVTPSTVSFATPAWPSVIYIFTPKEFISRVRLAWIGKDIPRDDARWMGKLLAGLSPGQIHDAFRAAGYTPAEVDAFSAVLARRITLLTDL